MWFLSPLSTPLRCDKCSAEQQLWDCDLLALPSPGWQPWIASGFSLSPPGRKHYKLTQLSHKIKAPSLCEAARQGQAKGAEFRAPSFPALLSYLSGVRAEGLGCLSLGDFQVHSTENWNPKQLSMLTKSEACCSGLYSEMGPLPAHMGTAQQRGI